jgi:lycopene cyclase domain-containing protein
MTLNNFTYFLILTASLAFPLILSFDKKVAFYKKWKFLFPAMILPALFYVAWDVWFTKMGVWSFNEKYIIGVHIFNLPIEEVLFFFVVPYCCVFIYECIRSYFPAVKDTPVSMTIFLLIGIILISTGVFFYDKYYTSITFIFTGIFICLLYFLKNYFRYFSFAAFLISYVIILIPFLIVNGFLTAIPVVMYNDVENLGIRLYTIPIEDIFYGMLLIMMNVAGYERKKNSHF